MAVRLPTKLKELRGTARADRLSVGEPMPSSASGYCPRYLPEEAKGWWRLFAPYLRRLGLLTVLDTYAVSQLVMLAYHIHLTDLDVEKHGLLIAGQRGGVVRNPALLAAASLRSSMIALLREFGMTPASRGRIDLPTPPNPTDPFREYLEEGRGGGNGH